MALGRKRAFVVSAVVLVAASGAACTTVLGLLPPTLYQCENGCADASAPPVPDGNGSPDSSVPSDAPFESALPDATPDAIADVVLDRGPSNGIRCGSGPTATFCALQSVCCLTFDDAGTASFACESSAAACSGYPIECGTNNDCSGTDVCCFYKSGIKCQPQNTSSCANMLVCEPSGPADQCPTHQACTIAYLGPNNYPLPYDGCH